MGNFTEVKIGGWVDTENVTGAEMTGLQSRIVKAINGDEGSSHAPTDAIVLAGAGLQIDTILSLFGLLEVGSTGTLQVIDGGAISVDATSTVTVTGGTVTIASGGTLALTSSDLTTDTASTATLDGTTEILGPLRMRVLPATDVNVLTLFGWNVYNIAQTTGSHQITCHVTTGTAPVDGQIIFVRAKLTGGTSFFVLNEGGGTIASLGAVTGTFSLTLIYIAADTKWHVLSSSNAWIFGADA